MAALSDLDLAADQPRRNGVHAVREVDRAPLTHGGGVLRVRRQSRGRQRQEVGSIPGPQADRCHWARGGSQGPCDTFWDVGDGPPHVDHGGRLVGVVMV
jgi:hypothetical protein